MSTFNYSAVISQLSYMGAHNLAQEVLNQAKQSEFNQKCHAQEMKRLADLEVKVHASIRQAKEKADIIKNQFKNRTLSDSLPEKKKSFGEALPYDIVLSIVNAANADDIKPISTHEFASPEHRRVVCTLVTVGPYFDKNSERICKLVSYMLSSDQHEHIGTISFWRENYKWIPDFDMHKL